MNSPLGYLASIGVRPQAITADSRRIHPGSLFLAYPGERTDGRRYIGEAIAQGAAAVLWECAGFVWNEAWQVPNLPVAGLREEAGRLASEFYGHPADKLWNIGITGTNGKTSCCHWLADVLTRLGRKTALIGTLGNGFPGMLTPAHNTTPDAVLLHGMLADYLKEGARYLAMEVSSHGLAQGRVNGMRFDVAIFTNLSHDHLDYHGDMEAYGRAKRLLFEIAGLKHAVINADDAYGAWLLQTLPRDRLELHSYGLEAGEIRGHNLQLNDQGVAMEVSFPGGKTKIEAPKLMGRFNAYNLLAVLASLLASGVDITQAAQALRDVAPVAGRMQCVGGGGAPLVVIDYAHTPDALEKVLLALREQARGRLILVFGCGGNRDKGKRPLMGEVASCLADEVIVTSDNPRHEDPGAIISNITAGMRGNYWVEIDRALAIRKAVMRARRDDVVLIAGKGHEDYQEIGNSRLPFSDLAVARWALEEREHENVAQ